MLLCGVVIACVLIALVLVVFRCYPAEPAQGHQRLAFWVHRGGTGRSGHRAD